MSERVCFQLHVKPDRIPAYIKAHAAVWPEMLAAIADSGRRNYSLFLRPDGLLIGYYETDSVEASQAALATDPRTVAWESATADYFVALDGRPDQNSLTLDEIFNLEDQIAKEPS